jgi:pyruvate kinase
MQTRTKIICTIGPAVNTYEKILELIHAGMNVARLNFSHGTHADHLKVIEALKQARTEKSVPLAIMLDTKGPEIRIGKVKDGKMALVAGQKLLLVKQEIEGDFSQLQVHPAVVFDKLEVGVKVLFDDGYITSTVVEVRPEGTVVEIHNSGILKSQKGVNIPGVDIDLPAMTPQDIEDIIFGCTHDIDLIAASFIRSAEHVLEIKRLLANQKKQDILVIAKIENSLGVRNFDSILQVADGVMVARGDLGVELPLKQVPRLQKMMIRKCTQAAKPVITATQMLESMIQNPRPTRAEVSDVANAIYDSTSAVMLSGETAVGLYAIDAVKMMKSIVRETEKDFAYRDFFLHLGKTDFNDISNSVALATVKTAYSSHAKAIFVFTSSGLTMRLVSGFRPEMPIIALTPSLKRFHQMALMWGVIPVPCFAVQNSEEAFTYTSTQALRMNLVQEGDLVVVTAGSPFGVSGTTNMMLVESIGNVLVRGQPFQGKRVYGKVALLHSVDEKQETSAQDRIVVITRCDETYLPSLKKAIGIILQNSPEDLSSEHYARQFAHLLNLPVLVRADGAMGLLHEDQQVLLDPEKGVVFKHA